MKKIFIGIITVAILVLGLIGISLMKTDFNKITITGTMGMGIEQEKEISGKSPQNSSIKQIQQVPFTEKDKPILEKEILKKPPKIKNLPFNPDQDVPVSKMVGK